MCTLSVIKLSHPEGVGFRVVHSRDEQRSRGQAYPPAIRTLGDDRGACRRVEYPTDSDAGGTWVVASESGVVAGVLNYQTNGAVNPNASQSRGEIPLKLIEHDSIGSMLDAIKSLDLSVYACFSAFGVAVEDGEIRSMVVEWDAKTLRVVREPSMGFTPIVIASSGLGDEKVQVRLPVFEEIDADRDAESQDRFHMHRWEDRPEYSVLMSRKHARTVSITTIEVSPASGEGQTMEMSYRELPENDPIYDPVGAGMLQ